MFPPVGAEPENVTLCVEPVICQVTVRPGVMETVAGEKLSPGVVTIEADVPVSDGGGCVSSEGVCVPPTASTAAPPPPQAVTRARVARMIIDRGSGCFMCTISQ